MEKLTRAQLLSLNQFLYFYPENVTFPEVLDMLSKKSTNIIIWRVFEEIPEVYLVNSIKRLEEEIRTLI